MAQESRLVIVIDAKNAERNARNLGNELDSIERKGDFATKSMDGLSVATRQLAGYMAGLATVGAAVSKMDTYTGIQNQLKLVTDGQKQLNTAMDNTFEIAQRSRSSWESTATVYQKLAMNAKDVGLAQEDIGRLTETISKGIALSGATADQADAAIMQLGQALGSGALRGDEFNSVMENGYGLMQLIAKGMNVPIGQLKSMAENGELTSEKVTKALLKMSDEADKQFGKTDATIGQSLGLLSNSLTQFIGEAGRSSGAAQVLSGSIEGLANNFELLADGAVVLGIGAITKAIISKTVAVQADLVASAAQKVADQAQKQDALILTTLKVNEAKAHLANVQATNAETQAKFGATAANARYKLASDAVTQAVIAQTAAQNALNKATSVGSKIFGLVGGWAGVLTIGVTALAAGYMYMQDRTEKANQKLKEQAEVANQAAEELRKLHGVEKQSAINDMTAALEAQNKALHDAELAAGAALIDIQNFAQGNVEVTKISNEARLGTISYTEALRRLNGMSIPPDLYNALKKQVEGYDQAYFAGVKLVDGLKAVGIEAKLQGNAAQNAANQNNIHANSLDGVAGAANNATNALSDYLKKLQQSTFKTELTNKLIGNYGFDPERAKAFAEAYVQNGNKISAQDAKIIDQNLAANRKLQASEEAVAQARRNSAAAARKSNSESSKANREAIKEANEARRLFEEQARLRDQFADSYAPKLTQIENDLQRELAEIRKANFGNEEKDYIAKATARAELNKELYLRELTYEINQFHWSEEQKLKYSYETKQMQIKEGTELTDDLKQIRLNALKQEHDQEVGMIQLAQEQRLFQAKLFLLSETEAMQERYRLEREEIAKTAKDEEEKRKRLALSRDQERLEALDRAAKAGQAWGGIQADMNGSGEFYRLDQERSSRLSAATNLLDSQQGVVNLNEQNSIEALNAQFEQQLISQQDFENRKTAIIQAAQDQRNQIAAEYAKNAQDIEDKYQQDRLNTQIAFGGQMMGSLTSMFGSMFGEQSKAYKIMFAADKAYAIAAAGIAIQQSIAQAAKVGFPTNIPLIASAIAQGASIIANIRAIKDQGFADGGYTGNGLKHTPAGIVHKGEVVWSQDDIKRWGGVSVVESMRQSKPSGYANGGYVSNNQTDAVATVREHRQFEAINTGRTEKSQPNVIINNYSSEKVETSTNSDGDLMVTIGKMVKEVARSEVDSRFRMAARQGGEFTKMR
ncbi:tape measure domain protein [Acinetobacter baumannii]|uniref:tape measure protein n=1 Tax=Acinetobacter baumannii TaxID=470 RepID=UPI0006720F0F|nr:tape measure protein [Acinetobacter baumannii]KMV05737.1 tape measure domain protein [Acinetobacter baumannii]